MHIAYIDSRVLPPGISRLVPTAYQYDVQNLSIAIPGIARA